MNYYQLFFLSLFIWVPVNFKEPNRSVLSLKPDNYRTSKHYGACLSPRMSKRNR